ncbi:MAG: hypothetical protein Q4A84_04865 [Neisseria sp.]|uniref:HvfA family oxazolone/thioamide-modified RiPP metallophore n=1 Tax=Neisseria sp. TaxID=192066 RepID=UPI0026DAD75E|nr:hypothetical protein [Neisseria sp.]MDO4641021.1 hypothetical protein [Neisseria sp.]
MKKSSSLIALAGALALLGGQSAMAAQTKHTVAAKTVKPAAKKAKEGTCGEGKCGASKAGAQKAKEGSCGEGKCGASKAAAKTGTKAAEGKCGEGKCGNKSK